MKKSPRKPQPDKPDWESIEKDVIRKLGLLRLAWEETVKTPEIHSPMRRDIYMPRLKLLAEFCTGIEEEPLPTMPVQDFSEY
jgi:hypothetical protein